MRGVVLQPADCTVNGIFAERSAGVPRSRSEAAQRFASGEGLDRGAPDRSTIDYAVGDPPSTERRGLATAPATPRIYTSLTDTTKMEAALKAKIALEALREQARVSRTRGGERQRPRPDALHRRTVHGVAVSRLATDHGAAARRGRRGQPQAGAAVDAPDGDRRTRAETELPIERPNQVWAADITYIPIGHGFL
jgi:hypothetical protein